jgi:hypothetical protein
MKWHVMSTLEAPPPTLQVRPWTDRVLDRHGHDPRDPYCERFWLPLLGPSAILLTRQLAERLDAQPDGFPLATDDASRSLGLGPPLGRRSAFNRTMHRLVQFRLLHREIDDVVLVKRRLPTLTNNQVERLPDSVRLAHDEWMTSIMATPAPPVVRERARSLALSLLELGESPAEVTAHLQRLRFGPALRDEAVAWASARIEGRTRDLPE